MSRSTPLPRQPIRALVRILPWVAALLVTGCAGGTGGGGTGGASPSAARTVHDLPPGVDRAPGREEPSKAEDVPLPDPMPSSVPDPARLLRWAVPDTGNRYGVDPATYTRVSTNAARVIVVIETGGGARNVTMEGIRCDTAQRKLLAIGRSDGTWSLPRAQTWQALFVTEALTRDRRPLIRALCDGPTSIENASRLGQRLDQPASRY